MNTAFVKIWGELVCAVAWDATTGYATFEYDSNLKTLDWDLAPLNMHLHAANKTFCFLA